MIIKNDNFKYMDRQNYIINNIDISNIQNEEPKYLTNKNIGKE